MPYRPIPKPQEPTGPDSSAFFEALLGGDEFLALQAQANQAALNEQKVALADTYEALCDAIGETAILIMSSGGDGYFRHPDRAQHTDESYVGLEVVQDFDKGMLLALTEYYVDDSNGYTVNRDVTAIQPETRMAGAAYNVTTSDFRLSANRDDYQHIFPPTKSSIPVSPLRDPYDAASIALISSYGDINTIAQGRNYFEYLIGLLGQVAEVPQISREEAYGIRLATLHG